MYGFVRVLCFVFYVWCFFLVTDTTGDEHDLLRVLPPGHVDGHPPLRPQDNAPCLPLHVSRRRPHGHDVPEAIRELTLSFLLVTLVTGDRLSRCRKQNVNTCVVVSRPRFLNFSILWLQSLFVFVSVSFFRFRFHLFVFGFVFAKGHQVR